MLVHHPAALLTLLTPVAPPCLSRPWRSLEAQQAALDALVEGQARGRRRGADMASLNKRNAHANFKARLPACVALRLAGCVAAWAAA